MLINKTLIKKEIKYSYKTTLIFIAVLTLYASMMTTMFDPEMGDMLASFSQSMPEMFAAFGMTADASTLVQFLANYLYGFIFVVFPMVYIVIMTSRLVTRYMDKGSMAYLLSTPNTRFSLIFTQAFLLCVNILFMVVFVTGLCTGISEGLFPNELEIAKFLLLNFGLFCLLFFLASVCFCFACIFNESRFATGAGSAFIIGTYIIQMISQIDTKFEFFKFFTPFTLFDPTSLADTDTGAIISVFVLLGLGIIIFGVGMKIFCKKDMSL